MEGLSVFKVAGCFYAAFYSVVYFGVHSGSLFRFTIREAAVEARAEVGENRSLPLAF